MTKVEAIRVLREVVDKPGIPDDAREALQYFLDREGPRRRRIVIDPDPIAAVRERRVEEPSQALAAYDEAHTRLFGHHDQTIEGRERQRALMRTRLLVRRDFAGDAQAAAVFFVRGLRFWESRAKRNCWPGSNGSMPSHEQICHPRIVASFKRGEIDREIGRR